MKYTQPGLGNATVFHIVFQIQSTFCRGISNFPENPQSANRKSHSQTVNGRKLAQLEGERCLLPACRSRVEEEMILKRNRQKEETKGVR
jgi:hypothetical protein